MSTKNYLTNVFRSNNNYTENNTHTKYDNITLNITNIITKHINNYNNGISNNYKISEIRKCKKHIITTMMILHKTKQVIITLMAHTIQPRIIIYVLHY